MNWLLDPVPFRILPRSGLRRSRSPGDEHGCEEIRFECNDELPRFRISDECRDDDVGVNDQLHSSSLRRFFFDALVPTFVDRIGDFLNVALGEFALTGEFVHHFERLDFLLDGLSCDLAPVDLRVPFHSLFEVVVHVDCDTGNT